MRMALTLVIIGAVAVIAACGDDGSGGVTLRTGGGNNGGGGSGGGVVTEDFCVQARAKFKDLADIHKYTIARTCASEKDTCHNDEDPPPMHTPALMLNMIDMPCNTGVPEMVDWDSFCTNGGSVIEAGDAENSYFIIRLRGPSTDQRSTRVQMPQMSSALTAEEMYAFTAWINSLEPGSKVDDPINYSKTPCPVEGD